MKTRELIETFDLKFGRKNTGMDRGMHHPQVIIELNRALKFFIEARCVAAQTSDSAREDLKNLYILGKKLESVDRNTEYSVWKYPSDFYKSLSITAYCTCKECNEKIPIQVGSMKAEKKRSMFESRFWSPSYHWKRLYGHESSTGIAIYQGENMSVKEVRMDYYKGHHELHCGSKGTYSYFGKSITKDTELLLDNRAQPETIVDIAILMATRDSGALAEMQAMLTEMSMKETYKA